jgi:perosamine synthetase
MIRLSDPTFNGNELKYLQECIQTGWVSSEGQFVGRFERELAAYHGSGFYATACSSGTAALQLALASLELRPGEIVLVPNISFLSTINAVLHLGGIPVLIDVDPNTMGLCPDSVKKWIDEFTMLRSGSLFVRGSGRRLFGMLAVHLYGIPCRINELNKISNEFGITLVEDNAEGIGALSSNQPTGSFGEASILSFNGNKTLTAGGGGMVVSRNKDLIDTAANWANHCRETAQSDPSDFGFNLKLTNLQAAVGLAQFEQLESFIEQRRYSHDLYSEGFRNIGLDLVSGLHKDTPSWWLHALKLPDANTLNRVQRGLTNAGIMSRRLFKPFSEQAIYKDFAHGEYQQADKLYSTILGLPSSSHLEEYQIKQVVDTITRQLVTHNRVAVAL